MEPFKNIYNDRFYKEFSVALSSVYNEFNDKGFLAEIIGDNWESLELKQRMRHTTVVLHSNMSGNYLQDLDALVKLSKQLIGKVQGNDALAYIFIPDYLEVYGLEHEVESVKAMETITQLSSCEFGIRPFFKKYPDFLVSTIIKWTNHPNEHVRRLASEGSRPRLPWGMALTHFKKDPSPILPVLEALKNDSSEYVRRSVANNLNDISKDHPDVVIDIAKKWMGQTKETDWVVKHAARTLLKAGNQEMMQLFGYGASEELKIENFKIENPDVNLGEYLTFHFAIKNTSNQPVNVRLEYAIYFLIKNGKHSKKVFKISEKEYEANSTTAIERRQHFKPITTRVYYSGTQKVAPIINGVEGNSFEFELKV